MSTLSSIDLWNRKERLRLRPCSGRVGRSASSSASWRAGLRAGCGVLLLTRSAEAGCGVLLLTRSAGAGCGVFLLIRSAAACARLTSSRQSSVGRIGVQLPDGFENRREKLGREGVYGSYCFVPCKIGAGLFFWSRF
jgi:hypothetical protein